MFQNVTFDIVASLPQLFQNYNGQLQTTLSLYGKSQSPNIGLSNKLQLETNSLPLTFCATIVLWLALDYSSREAPG